MRYFEIHFLYIYITASASKDGFAAIKVTALGRPQILVSKASLEN